jgi:putative FmdB family regulatory protein
MCPKYDWACEACEKVETVDRKFAECYIPPDTECEECGAEKWRKLLNTSIMRWRFVD